MEMCNSHPQDKESILLILLQSIEMDLLRCKLMVMPWGLDSKIRLGIMCTLWLLPMHSSQYRMQ